MTPLRYSAIGLVLAACGSAPTEQVPPPPPPGGLPVVSVAPNNASVSVGDSIQLAVTFSSSGATSFTWTSSDTLMATVTPQGWAIGHGPGRLAITACVPNAPECGSAVLNVR